MDTFPAAQVDGRDPVNERRVEQATRGVDKTVDLEELSGDHGVGLAGGQHPVRIGVGDAHRRRSRPLHLGQRQVTSGANCQAAAIGFAAALKNRRDNSLSPRRRQPRNAKASSAATVMPCP